MNIKRTLLISSASIGAELISKLNNELLLSYKKEYADLLMKKVALVKVDEDLSLSSTRPDSKIDFEKPADFWIIPDVWQAYYEKESEIESLIRNTINAVSSGEDDLKLSMIEKTIIDPNINVLVILPVYKPAESVFLPFIIEKVFIKLGIPGYNYHIIGLLPGLEDGEENEKYLPRAYACISECEKILIQKQDLINSFALLSAQNERNIHMGKTKEIFPTLQEYLNMSFFNHQTVADLRATQLSYYRNKPSFFSSWGFTTYVFKRDRFEKHFENRLTIKSIDEFFKAYNEPVERDLFFTEVGQLVGELKWSDKNKLLEDAEGYVPFSKSKKLSAQSFKGKKKDETKNVLEEARKNHEETHEGYYRNNYLVSLSKNMAEQTRESQRIIAEKIKTYLDQGLNGVKKAYALTFALLGKDESGVFRGRAAIDPVNLRTARDQIAEFYKQYLPEEERISQNDIRANERAIKTKQEESDRLLRKIENLEVKLFGKVEELSEIEESEDKLFFTIDGQKVHISGARDMVGPIPDSINSYVPTLSGSLPKIVDLRPFMTPVEDQKQVGSCTANALVGAYEYLIKRSTQKVKDFSRLFVYYNGREKGGYANEDKGSAICYCTESMMEKGVCLESTWDYLPEKVTEKPAPKAYQEAEKYKVIVAEYFDTDLELMKKCLAEGYPFVFGLKLYKSFQKVGSKGIVPIPDTEEASMDIHGYHAMLCVGYSEEEKCFIVRNSWGEQWGDKGYCYIPYEYIAERNHRSNTKSNFLLKTISDVEINEKEIVKNIAKDSGSLFNFSYDIHDLNAYKENRENLKAEIDELRPELENLRQEFTRQREKVLMEDFRGEAEEMEVDGIKEEQDEVLKEIGEVEETLKQLQGEKQNLIEKSKRLKIKLLIIYPAVTFIALLIAAGIAALIWSWFDVVQFLLSQFNLLITIGLTGLIIYAIWALLKYKREAIDKLNALQDEINLQSDKRNGLLTRLIGLYDKYFEIRRTHKLYDIYYSFIMVMREHVEYLREYFDKWADRLESQKNELKKELPENEFADTNIVFHAVSENNLRALIDKQDVKQDYYQNGSKPMTEFFINNKNEFVDASVGVKSFNEDLISSSRKNHNFQQMQSVDIFDFLFDNEMLLGIFPALRKRPLDEKLDVYAQFCRPFIRVNATTDAISSHQLFELQLPKDDTENYRFFIDQAKKKFGGNVSEYDNRNDRSSGVVFFSVISSLPAYVLEPVQAGFHAFISLDNAEQSKLFIKAHSGYSCIPENIKDII